ncbi:craniofacial development protein 2-like [Octopus bimaculoides]|uniref:craniofacial development protein 2-like n=1 Tax=Octopus bimaculoides TaxID=37653 RepID=UPI0022E034EE|nr:craniofacial development protein 2-like [Octopus bimaculoides]
MDITDPDKTAIIDKELTRPNVDITARQETRLADSGFIRQRNHTFFWKGLGEDERRIHGVGFAVYNRLLNKFRFPRGINERITIMEAGTKTGRAHLISAYVPILTAENDKKDQFYEELQDMINSIPRADKLSLMSNFNARIGADHQVWPKCLGQFGLGKINDNGQRLFEFFTNNNLCIASTFYNGKDRHKVSWCHPRSGYWLQIDFVIVRKNDVNAVKQTRSFHSADCNTNNLLVIVKVKMVTKKTPRAEKPKKPKINKKKNAQEPVMRTKFQEYFEEQLQNVAHPLATCGTT